RGRPSRRGRRAARRGGGRRGARARLVGLRASIGPDRVSGVGNVASEPVIDLRDVSVRYVVPHERIPTFKEFAIRWLRRRLQWREFEALAHVTLRIAPGESVGIVGSNGAGKTTLLKVIARVLRPVEGTVMTHGRIAPLLELGAGFDPELSGRENVFLNGALLG